MRANIHLFRVCGHQYIYDVPKNTILRVNNEVYKTIQNAISRNKDISPEEFDIIDGLISEGFLSKQYVETFVHPMTKNIEMILNHSLHMLTLQVTQNCNLRCKYCLYSGSYINRQHNNKRMSFETAKKAIDYYINRSIQAPKLRFGFYGGEPTLEMELIRKCVAYINGQAAGKPIEYNLTTNATILNGGMVRFLAENNFFLTISLDGPKEVQDKNRIYAESGKGTFDKIMEKVAWLKTEWPDYLNNIHFNVVMDPDDGYSISNDFFMNDNRVNDIYVTATEKNDVNYKEKVSANLEYYEKRSYERFKIIYDHFRNIGDKVSPLEVGYLAEIKKNIVDALKADSSGFKTGHPGGPCVPGLQRLFVNADGNFYPCERTNEDAEIMKIGDIEQGINIEKAKQLLNVGKITEESCRVCWVFRLCTACAVYAEDGDKLSQEKRLSRCKRIRSFVESYLKSYCVLREMRVDFDSLEVNEGWND